MAIFIYSLLKDLQRNFVRLSKLDLDMRLYNTDGHLAFKGIKIIPFQINTNIPFIFLMVMVFAANITFLSVYRISILVDIYSSLYR